MTPDTLKFEATMAEVRDRRRMAALLRRYADAIESDMLKHRPRGLAIVLASDDGHETNWVGLRTRTAIGEAGSALGWVSWQRDVIASHFRPRAATYQPDHARPEGRPPVTPDTPDDLAPAPPGAPPSVRAALAEARRVLDEDVSPGPWNVLGAARNTIGVSDQVPSVCLVYAGGGDVNSLANARVLAAARRLLGHAIEAVEGCTRCRYFAERKRDDPAVRCRTCQAFLHDIMAATGQGRGEG